MSFSQTGGRAVAFEIVIPAVEFAFNKPLLRKIMAQAGQEIKATARALIGRDASGRRYGKHVASGPGQPPASLSGRLASSLRVKSKGERINISDIAQYTSGKHITFYARFMETGAIGGGGPKGSHNLGRSHKRGAGPGKPQTQRRMAARPFLTVAAEGEMPGLTRRINEALTRSIDLKTLRKNG